MSSIDYFYYVFGLFGACHLLITAVLKMSSYFEARQSYRSGATWGWVHGHIVFRRFMKKISPEILLLLWIVGRRWWFPSWPSESWQVGLSVKQKRIYLNSLCQHLFYTQLERLRVVMMPGRLFSYIMVCLMLFLAFWPVAAGQ